MLIGFCILGLLIIKYGNKREQSKLPSTSPCESNTR
jgi:hypothetical protein